MSKTLKRRLLIGALFTVSSLVAWLGTGNSLVFIYGALVAGITILLEFLLYAKRGVFLFALAGLIAGYFSGMFVYELFGKLAPNIFKPEMEPFFILCLTYLGFSLPMLASQKTGYSLNMPMGGDTDKKSSEIKLLDTSVVIDGRIADIAATGFLSGTLILPKFVLNEIQALADSKDPIKRSRARRGLDVLNKLKEIPNTDLKIYTRDYPEIRGVDAKLIALAKELGGSIITNDYNLNKVAKLDGIQILNLNDLTNALKAVLLPSEEFELDVIKEGKESNQGVGYLSDGTMVVVANGIHLIGKKVGVRVTSILQTSAGRIIFTEVKR